MFVLLPTAVLNFGFPQILELMLEDRVALCMGQMEVRMALTYWILSSSVQREVTAHKKYIFASIKFLLKQETRFSAPGEKRVNFLALLGFQDHVQGRGEAQLGSGMATCMAVHVVARGKRCVKDG